MDLRTWPIARSIKGTLCHLGIPQRLGDGKPYTQEHYQSFPSLEEIAGENWYSEILALLLGKNRWVAWWTTKRVLKNSGLQAFSPSKLPDRLELANINSLLWARSFFMGGLLILADLSDSDIRSKILEWSGCDTEYDAEFLFTAPDTFEWEFEPILNWCRDKKVAQDTEDVVPAKADRIIALFDGDIYCALAKVDAEPVLDSLAILAETWGLKLITGPETYGWLPNLK